MNIFHTEKESAYEESAIEKETLDHQQVELEALTASQSVTLLSLLQAMLSITNNQGGLEESI